MKPKIRFFFFFGEGRQFKKIISCEEFELFLTKGTRCDVRASACSHSPPPPTPSPPPPLHYVCGVIATFPGRLFGRGRKCGAVRGGAGRWRTWYRPCRVPTRRVTSSTTERSCCSSCSSWYRRGGPRTALPERGAR